MSGQYKQQKFKFIDENMQIPRNYDLEREVLGELLILGEEAITNFDSTITPKTFYNENHSIVYATMLKLVKQKKPLDLINLAMQLKADDKLDYIGGSSYLSGLISKVASTAHIKQHIEQLRQYEVNRDLFCLSEEVKVLANDPTSDSSDTIEFIEKSLTDLRVSNKSCALTMTDSISVFYDWLQTNMEHKSTIPTGLKSLDKILNGGFKSPDLIILGGRPSMGKALPITSHVLTPKGWKLMGDMKVGDEVVSINGEKSYVTGVFPQGGLETYEITFNDGRTTECCGEHLWEVFSTRFGKLGGETRVMNTKQIADKLQTKRFQGRMSIPKFSGIFGDSNVFNIHPYILGVLIGDGDLSSGAIWNKPEVFVKEKIKSLIPVGYEVSEYGGDRYGIINSIKGGTKNLFIEELRQLGLMGKRSYEKFIPDVYKMCSREQRIQLLQGLLDSDGFADKGGIITFSSSSKKLAQDVQELCWSLGYVCTLRVKKAFLNGERKRDAYILSISTDTPSECFSLPRKLERACEKKRCRPCTIMSVKKKGRKVECQCISVSHERALYVTDQYIMTHNTQFATFFAEEAAKLGKHVYFVSIEMTAMQLVARMTAREGISYSNMRQGRLTSSEWSMIDSRASELQKLKINIADSPDCRQLSYIKSEARLLKRKGELDIMFVDYLGLIKTNMRFEKRYIEVGYITGELKALAKELQIPIILLAQLSRPPQGREKETPKMEALRESGDIEQDADIIIFPHRPYVYDSTAVDEMGRSWKDRGVLLIEKNREGQRNVKCFFENDPQFKNFCDDEQANEKLDNTTA